MTELLAHRNSLVSSMAENVGKLIIEHDLSEGTGEFADMIKQHRYEIHNREWLGSMMDDEFSKRYYNGSSTETFP